MSRAMDYRLTSLSHKREALISHVQPLYKSILLSPTLSSCASQKKGQSMQTPSYKPPWLLPSIRSMGILGLQQCYCRQQHSVPNSCRPAGWWSICIPNSCKVNIMGSHELPRYGVAFASNVVDLSKAYGRQSLAIQKGLHGMLNRQWGKWAHD